MSSSKFYIIVEHDTTEAFVTIGDDETPKAYDTEAEARAEAKDYSGSTLVLQSVAEFTDVTTRKVKKLT